MADDRPRCSRPSTAGEVDLGFVAIENSIEGTVNVTIDTLAFEHDLLIQREVVTRRPAQPAGRRRASRSADIDRGAVVPASPPAQCRTLPGRASCPASRSWPPTPPPRRPGWWPSEADGRVGRHRARAGRQDLRPRRAGRRHRGPPREPDPVRRWSAATAIPAPTGHDKTTIVVFQRADRPGLAARHPPGVRRPGHQPHQARVPAHQEGPRRLLLHHRPRGPRRRRAGGRLPARPPAPSRPTSSSSARTRPPASTARPSAATPTPPGAPPTNGSTTSDHRSSRSAAAAAFWRADAPVPARPARQNEWVGSPGSGGRVRLNAGALKAPDPQGSGGSNPSRSA